MSMRGSPASGSQYARLSPTQPTTRSEPSTTAATNVHEAGLARGPATVLRDRPLRWPRRRPPRAPAPVAATRAGRRCRCPLGDERGQDVARGTRGRQAGDVRVGRVRHPVAHHEDRVAAGLGPGVQRDGVLVAVVADAPVTHGGHPRGRLLGEVVARAAGLGAAHGAVAVGGDLATALVHDGRLRRRWLSAGVSAGRAGRAGGVGARLAQPVRGSSAPQASQYCSPAATGAAHVGALSRPVARVVIAGSIGVRRWPGRPARPAPRVSVRSPASSRYAASRPSRRTGSDAGCPPIVTAGSSPCVSTTWSADCSTSTRNRDRSTGSMVRLSMLCQRGGQGAEPAARLGQQPRPAAAAPGCTPGWSAAPGRARGSRPSTSPRPDADPGQAEGGGRDVVGIGAGAGDVERLGHVGLAAGLAGERQGQLGRELARHLAVDRVERALRVGRPAPGECDEPGHPGSTPLPRVLGEQLLRRAVGQVVVARPRARRATWPAAPRG